MFFVVVTRCSLWYQLSVVFALPFSGCLTTLNSTFGEIDYNGTSNSYARCQWIILSAAISQAVALVSVQELNFGHYFCR